MKTTFLSFLTALALAWMRATIASEISRPEGTVFRAGHGTAPSFPVAPASLVKVAFEPDAGVVNRPGDPRESPQKQSSTSFPPAESQGGWRTLRTPDELRKMAGVDPQKIEGLKQWLLESDNRNFAAVVIRHGYIILEVERGNSAKTDSRRVASVSKAICATVLAIAAEQSQSGRTPRRMSFGDPAFQFIPWAAPLSDPRKAKITVRQLLNHTSGICPEATGAPNDGSWEYILGHSGDPRTARLAFDPGTACGYSSHAFAQAALVCENVTGKPYDEFAIENLFKPLGIEHWWFQYYEGAKSTGATRLTGSACRLATSRALRIACCIKVAGAINR